MYEYFEDSSGIFRDFYQVKKETNPLSYSVKEVFLKETLNKNLPCMLKLIKPNLHRVG